MKPATLILIASMLIATSSCFKEIDTVSIPRTIDKSFIVQNSIRTTQSFFRFYEYAVLEVSTASPYSWDLGFESGGEGNRVIIGYASKAYMAHTGTYDMANISIDMVLDMKDSTELWIMDDPSFINNVDSLSLRNRADGEVYLLDRGGNEDRYYAIQFVEEDEESYTFRFAAATSLETVEEVRIIRKEGYNYVYYSLADQRTVNVEPLKDEWDIMTTPYTGWWESDPGVYAPFYQSGLMINNERGARIARVFDPEVSFSEISLADTAVYEFTDMKGAIGANWKLLGAVGSSNLYTMDPDKKYILKKYDLESDRTMYFKLQIVDYILKGEDHHPTIEFIYLGQS